VNTCAEPGGALVAGLRDLTARTANTDSATWAFSSPAATSISNAVLWRAGDADGGAAVNATYQFWLAGPGETSIFEECLYALGCSSRGDSARPYATENRVQVPAANLGTHLYAKASCGGVSEFKCKEGPGDPNHYAAVLYLFAADITLEQAAGPTASAVSGELATAPAVAGTTDVAFSAADPGAGVYAAVFSVDGTVVQRTPLDSNGGRCRDVGGTSDGLAAFLYVQPCLSALSADVGLDTTQITDGPHHLVVDVVDAAGNSAPVLDRNIVVANPARPGAGAAGGAPGPANGAGASTEADLTVAWNGTRSSRLVTTYGRVETITGRLTGPGGAPIAGAQIDVTATPAAVGASPAAMVSPHTRPNGIFTLRIPPGACSRSLRFSYRVHAGDPLPVATRTLTLAVRAPVSLSVRPSQATVGTTIRFAGRLRGGRIPPGGKLVVLEARSGGRWLKFEVVRSDSRGRFFATYRFHFPGPATYRFRALAAPEAAYPFAAGTSRSVVVRER
jgi:hypothetical protein